MQSARDALKAYGPLGSVQLLKKMVGSTDTRREVIAELKANGEIERDAVENGKAAPYRLVPGPTVLLPVSTTTSTARRWSIGAGHVAASPAVRLKPIIFAVLGVLGALVLAFAAAHFLLPASPAGDPLYAARFVVQVFEMVGVVGAVVLALWDRLRGVIFAPSFKFDFRDPTSPIVEELIQATAGKPAVQFSCDLVLTNTSRTAATGCRLVIAECQKMSGKQTVKLAKELRPAPSPWSDARQTIDIHKAVPVTLRLFTVEEQPGQGSPTVGSPVSQPLAALTIPWIHVLGTTDPLVLSAGEYRLKLGILTEKGVRADATFDLTYGGTWHDRLGTMRESLTIAKVTE